MIKKLLTVVFLAMLTLTTATMPDDALAEGKRKAVASKSSKKAKSKGGKKAVARGKSKKSGSRVARNSRGKKSRRSRGEFIARGPSVSIPPDRVREIQIALKREGYFADEPSGEYNKLTVEAMTKYQQDHNFRKTGYPTAESLQKLGLTRQRRVTTGEPTNENKTSVETIDNNSNPPQQPIAK